MDRLFQLQAFEGDNTKQEAASRGGGLRSFEIRERLKRPASASHVGRLVAGRSAPEDWRLEVAGRPSVNAECARPTRGRPSSAGAICTFSGQVQAQPEQVPSVRREDEDAILGIAEDNATTSSSSSSPREPLATTEEMSEALKGPSEDVLYHGGISAGLRGSLPRS
eukprot:2088063-Amphidinium_carterae.1